MNRTSKSTLQNIIPQSSKSSFNNLHFTLPLQTKQALTKLLKSCTANPKQLNQIHGVILTTGFSIKNSLLTQLLTSFIALDNMLYARKLFDEMHKPRTFLWNTVIRGYVKNDLPDMATSLYRMMHRLGIRPDAFTYPHVIKACSKLGNLSTGLVLHSHVVKHGLEFVNVVRTELMIMYMRFGDLDSGNFLFKTMLEKDLVAWNAMITLCTQTGYADKALDLFRQMGMHGIKPDAVTIVNAFSACGQLGCLEIGEEIYRVAREEEEEGIEYNTIVRNARLDMYVKCGEMDMARVMFEQMSNRNVVSWTTMVSGYAMNGESEEALTTFSRMKNDGIQPNHVTYLAVLSACSHAGLVNDGWTYFNRMDKNIRPRKEHYACMVDLLGRSGHLEEAYSFIKTMPMEPDAGIWGALLGSCAIHNDIVLGQHVADSLFQLASDTASYHVLLSNMYAAAGRWECVDKVRLEMRKHGVKKVAAYSSIEFDGEIYVFHRGARSRSHPQSDAIYKKLEELFEEMKIMGFVPKVSSVFHDIEQEEKEATLGAHSEKLAVAFGLLNVRGDKPIRVIKNLRVCDDCHTFFKFVSEISSRDIIMRDKNRFHHFRNGVCSCKDFW